jgi:hypothetical protein
MTRLEALRAMHDDVRTGAIPDDAETGAFKVLGFTQMRFARSAYDGSLDAAHSLHKSVLPGWEWDRDGGIMIVWTDGVDRQIAYSDSPARAWLLAVLSALIAQEEANDPAPQT